MNERIEKLADQALQLVANEHMNGDESRLNTDSLFVKALIQEKFAELIVRECADRLMQDDFGSVKGVMSIAGARLKEHFGIE